MDLATAILRSKARLAAKGIVLLNDTNTPINRQLLANCELANDSNQPSEAPPCPAVERSTTSAGKDKD